MATHSSNPDGESLHPVADFSGGVAALAGPEVDSSPSSPHRLRLLYEYMLKCSLVRERTAELQRQGRIETATAQPFRTVAAGVGSLVELRSGDAVAAQDTVLMHVLRHAPLEYIFCALYGFESEYRTAHPNAVGQGFHLVPRVETLASQFSVAAGMAMAARLQNRHGIVLAHAADGFNAMGFWHEAASLASRERLPLVFVFESNTSAMLNLEDSILRDRAESYGMPGITVEGGDVVAVWRVTQESIHRARSGAGPTMIDCRVAPSPAANGKANNESKSLAHMQHYLDRRGHWDAQWARQLEADISGQIEKAVAAAEKIRHAQ